MFALNTYEATRRKGREIIWRSNPLILMIYLSLGAIFLVNLEGL
jgi:hypothetical protein